MPPTIEPYAAKGLPGCWQLKTRTLDFQHGPAVMGIVNATPDSFSDGGKFFEPAAAIAHGIQLAQDGARIIDVGGESTRPYSQPVDTEEEIRRVVPVIQGIAESCEVAISIDTSKARVAAAAIEAGAEIINDVTGLEGDPAMVSVARESQAGICAMHMQGTPQTMQDDPHYQDVVEEIFQYLQQRKQTLLEAGLDHDRICLDPGIGFGKTHQHNLQLMAGCRRFTELQSPILVGHSRKGFIGKLIGDADANRDTGTLALSVWLYQQGVHVIRVHEVADTVQALGAIGSVLKINE